MTTEKTLAIIVELECNRIGTNEYRNQLREQLKGLDNDVEGQQVIKTLQRMARELEDKGYTPFFNPSKK